MKRMPFYWLGIVFCLFSYPAIAQFDEKPIPTTIDAVQLHLQGAEIKRLGKLTLSPGKYNLVFSDLSPKIFEKTIQIKGIDGLKILSITSKNNFLNRRKPNPKIKVLEDSVQLVRQKIQLIEDEDDAFAKEAAMLDANRTIPDTKDGDWVEQLKQTGAFFRERNLEINKTRTELSNQLEKKHQRLFDLQLQLYELNASREAMSEVYLVVEITKAINNEDLELSYVVGDAGWSSIYDLQAKDFSPTIELSYRALAYNNTGVDWNDVKLSLSTADPFLSTVPPDVEVWRLDESYTSEVNNLYVNIQQESFKGYGDNDWAMPQQQQIGADLGFVQQLLGEDYDARMNYETELYIRYRQSRIESAPETIFEEIDIPNFNATFEIEQPYTIPADRKPYSIEIDQFNLPTNYKHYAVPKLDHNAFLMAQVVGWEDLNLVSGPVNLYSQEQYLGMSYLGMATLTDTLEISLGRDPLVEISREKVKEESKRQTTGSFKKVKTAYSIKVKSNHKQAIDLELVDQIPITSDKDITITLGETSDAVHDQNTGLLTWRRQFAQNQEKTFEFEFSIKYPKDKKVRVQYNTIKRKAAPRFY